MNNFDIQFLSIMRRILDTGIDRPDRTGIGSRAIWGATMDIDLSEGFPAPTHRKVALRIAFEEIMWMWRGSTDSKLLEAKNINIWKGNTSREFLDGRGLHDLPEGHIGKGYSFQWRNFGGGYKNDVTTRFLNDYSGFDNSGADQVIQLLEGLQKDPNGRRHIITGWNPTQLKDMALPPCHLYQQYQILDGKLNSSFVMRSNDLVYGLSYNVMGYALLNHIIAKYLKIVPGKLFYVGMDVHIYENQMDMARELVDRTWFDLPTLKINKELNTIDDIMSLQFEDIELIGYKAHPDIKNKPKMAV